MYCGSSYPILDILSGNSNINEELLTHHSEESKIPFDWDLLNQEMWNLSNQI